MFIIFKSKGILHLLSKESGPYPHSCHIGKPEFRSSVFHLNLGGHIPVQGEHKVNTFLAGRLRYKFIKFLPVLPSPQACGFSAFLPISSMLAQAGFLHLYNGLDQETDTAEK